MKIKQLLFMMFTVIIAGTFIAMLTAADYTDKPLHLPTESIPFELTLTSDACCFWISDVTISIVSEDGSQIETLKADILTEGNIISFNQMPSFTGPVSINIEFDCHYSEDSKASIYLIDFDDMEHLKDNGCLITFQEREEARLLVKSGGIEVLYKQDQREPSYWAAD